MDHLKASVRKMVIQKLSIIERDDPSHGYVIEYINKQIEMMINIVPHHLGLGNMIYCSLDIGNSDSDTYLKDIARSIEGAFVHDKKFNYHDFVDASNIDVVLDAVKILVDKTKALGEECVNYKESARTFMCNGLPLHVNETIFDTAYGDRSDIVHAALTNINKKSKSACVRRLFA